MYSRANEFPLQIKVIPPPAKIYREKLRIRLKNDDTEAMSVRRVIRIGWGARRQDELLPNYFFLCGLKIRYPIDNPILLGYHSDEPLNGSGYLGST